MTPRDPVAHRVVIGLALLGLVLTVGTVGYAILGHVGFVDALYMTVITVATVGFREVVPLDTAGKLFTVVLILAGVGAIGYSFGSFIEFMLEGHLLGLLEERKMIKRIETMSGHTVVCGMGRVGYEVCRQLAEHGTEFVVVDQCVDCVERAKGEGWSVIHGDAAEEDALASAGLVRAKSLVAALDTDADNVFVVLTARTMCPTIFIVARATGEISEPKLLRAGANRVLTPTVIGGRRMASMVLHPLVTDYLDLVSRAGAGFEFRLEEVLVPAASSLEGMVLRDAHLHSRFGAFVLAVQHADGSVDAKPGADTRIVAGDVLILLGESAQLDALAQSL